jgi:hypothetical protein
MAGWLARLDRSLGERGRTLARGAALGFGLGAGGVLLVTAVWSTPRGANGVVFPLAAMCFGFGLAAWASALLYGPTLERGVRRATESEGFSSEGTADAMGLLTVIGLAGMVGSSVAALALGALLS